MLKLNNKQKNKHNICFEIIEIFFFPEKKKISQAAEILFSHGAFQKSLIMHGCQNYQLGENYACLLNQQSVRSNYH